ncbi:SDR family oxidoreductase [Glaciecola siphonariae]|uniref:SDR family oxidoreductase n=1 Tax=Glaciecola siphonariae TaxID=521012 RepID=A0ABV9LS99_9ALTE
MKLQDKVVLVTGGNSGIGKASAALFKAEGAKLIITGRNDSELKKAADELGVDYFLADASSVAESTSMAAYVKEKYGKLDVLFANAGVTLASPTMQESESDYDLQFAINTKGIYFAVQAILPLMSKGSSIIVNTSCLSVMGSPGMASYSATKAAVRSFVRTWAIEFAEMGIRTNAVSPGPINTPIYAKLGMPQEQLEEMAAGIVQKIPMGRFGEPEEIAKAALFLASDDSSFVNGIELFVDGGMGQI